LRQQLVDEFEGVLAVVGSCDADVRSIAVFDGVDDGHPVLAPVGLATRGRLVGVVDRATGDLLRCGGHLGHLPDGGVGLWRRLGVRTRHHHPGDQTGQHGGSHHRALPAGQPCVHGGVLSWRQL
jgi:hypothetical protein